MARGIYGDEFKNKVKVTIYLPGWQARKLKYVGNQSRFIESSLNEANPDWAPPGPKSAVEVKKR